MDYIKEIFNRANLQQLREFLLHESGTVTDTRSYQERLEAAYRQLLDFLKELPREISEPVLENIHAYTGTIEAVYMEIGLQAGAKLAIQLLETGGGNNVLEK